MKKIALAGLVAISMMAITQQQADAWVNSRFSMGLNWQRQAGGNNFFWGAWRNGQPPGPEAFGTEGAWPNYVAPMPSHHSYAPMPQYQAPQQAYYPPAPAPQANYAGEYSSPFQFATYPRPIYYYPDSTFYYYGR
jgi:hypothetical protein